ncbi:hypothetical protein CRE_11447 [Caenorhabditis remanei]|uniref:F-box domain-containing protein n=1 Tax=Caenorhabditis remanei TaxID=31234 RepID=E3NBD4_CAERE|nr:hypothetical protein CRE_11447 [Caenorhabditis remanei]
MVDPPSTPPTDLRALIIYDIYQWKTVEKSYDNYSNLCDSLRIDNISFGDFEYWFNRYSKEYYYSVKNGRSLPLLDISACVFSDFINGKSAEYSFNQISEALGESIVKKEDFQKWRNSFSIEKRESNDEESQKAHTMAELADRDPLAIRARILKEFGKVQAFITTHPKYWRSVTLRAHKRLCEAMGYDYVDYPEFEFWVLRFLHGNFELEYNRSSDPKARSFTDLPLDVFNKIGEYLSLEDRFQLRDVCKDFRYQVDNWGLKVDEIYYKNADVWHLYQKSSAVCRFYVNNRSRLGFYRNPISFVMNMLKHPRYQLEKLAINKEDKYWKKLIKKLDESNRKLRVKKVNFESNGGSSKIDLHFMVPGVLEEIKMYLLNPTRKELNEIIESEQCQSAKMVYIESLIGTPTYPLDVLYNCPRFTLKLGGDSGTKANFLKKLMKYGKVQKCVLYISTYIGAPSQIMWYFNEPEAMVPNFPSLRRYPIPETNEFYELEYQEELDYFEYREEFIHLERKQ